MTMKTRTSRLLLLLVFVAARAVVAEEAGETVETSVDTGERTPLHTVVPMYPERALRERLEGIVEVCFNVDREGRTSRIGVRYSSHRVFEKPSILAVRRSSYRPLDEGQTLSGIKTCRTFRFLLDPVAIEDPSGASGDV